MVYKSYRNMLPKRRRRALGLLMIPFALLIWCVGWNLFWIGEAKQKLRPRSVNQTAKLSLAVLLPQPKLKLRNRECMVKAPEKII